MPAIYSWPLASPPSSPTPSVPSDPGGEFRGTGRTGIVGILTPFRRDGISDFASGGGVALMASKVLQVLATECTGPTNVGELPWRPRFGSLFYTLRHRNNDRVLEELARVYAADALGRWLPSVRVVDCTIERFVPAGMTEPNRTGVRVRVYFEVVGTNGVVLGSGDVPIDLSR